MKAGDFDVHPGIAGEVGYDSNYFQRSGDGAPTTPSPPAAHAEPVISAYRLRITPSLSFQTSGRAAEEGGGPPPSLKLNGRFSASYNALFPANGFSDQISKQNNTVGLNAGLGADILPDKPWGVDLGGDFMRVIEASNDADVPNAFRRDTVRGGAGINWRPGGGLFVWRLGYGVTYTHFEESSFNNLDNVQHRIETSGRWSFLPRTAFVYKGEIGFLSYGSGGPDRHDGQLLRSQVGLNGLFTNHFGFLGLVGWGATFFDSSAAAPGQNFDSVIGQAEITWYPTPQPKLLTGTAPVGLSSVAIGYTRNYAASYLGDYFQRDRGYANFSYFFAQRFVVTLAGGLSAITRPLTPGFAIERPDGGELRADATGFFEFRPGDSIGINATVRYDAELNKIVVAGDDLKFARYQAFLGLRWFL